MTPPKQPTYALTWAAAIVTVSNVHIGANPVASAAANVIFYFGPYSRNISNNRTKDNTVVHVV